MICLTLSLKIQNLSFLAGRFVVVFIILELSCTFDYRSVEYEM